MSDETPPTREARCGLLTLLAADIEGGGAAGRCNNRGDTVMGECAGGRMAGSPSQDTERQQSLQICSSCWICVSVSISNNIDEK